MWKNILLVSSFFALTPIVIGTSAFALFVVTKPQKSLAADNSNKILGTNIYSPSSAVVPQIETRIKSSDARIEIIRQYLHKYNSPLEPYSAFLVETSDKYDLDFRLLVAIAHQESALCKIIPENSYNCWGWGIHSRGTLRFSSFDEGIETVAKGLRNEYLNKGYVSVDEIMDKWVPHSPERAWSKAVTHFIENME